LTLSQSRNDDLREIGNQLGVANILEGSVRKGGDRVRITAQLVKVENGFHLWSETYDRELIDVLKVQDEIAAAVIEQLKVTLLDASGSETSLHGFRFGVRPR
jgi:TolB-like protein